MGVAILLVLRFPHWAAYTLFGLFAVQFLIPGMYGRLIISAVYAAIALALLVVHRHQIIPTLAAPFRPVRRAIVSEPEPERALVA
jgi:cation:H+ antiporter